MKPNPSHDEDVHLVYHRFARRFKSSPNKYKLKGYALICAVAAWAKRYPNQVFTTHCDDSWFTDSYLILIEHSSTTDYMGTTVVYIPQCTGEEPIEFFLYRNHQFDLMHAFTKLGKVRESL